MLAVAGCAAPAGRLAPVSRSAPAATASGNVEDLLAARIVAGKPWFVRTGQGCEGARFQSAVADGGVGQLALAGQTLGYAIDSGFLVLAPPQRAKAADRRALRGASADSVAFGQSELFFSLEACTVHSGRSAAFELREAPVAKAEEPFLTFDPARHFLAWTGPLYWPMLTSRGVVCQPQRLDGAEGSVLVRSGQEQLAHHFAQDVFGVLLTPEPGYTFRPAPTAPFSSYLMGSPSRLLPVHGEDESSFFVAGSRWFRSGPACEAHKHETRPLELDFVRRLTPYLAAMPELIPARTPLRSWAADGTWFRAGRGECEMLNFSPFPMSYQGGPQRGRLRVSSNRGDELYEYELYPDPLSIWLSPRGIDLDRLRGELHAVAPAEPSSDAEPALRVGGEPWFTTAQACRQHVSRTAQSPLP